MLCLALVAALLFTGALLLSDRAPGLLRTLFGDEAQRLWERIDRARPATDLTADVASQPDALVHVLIWSVVALLASLVAWSWRALPFVAGGIAVVSLLIELAQGVWLTTREVERSDALANLVGVGLGCALAAAVMVSWSTLARMRRV